MKAKVGISDTGMAMAVIRVARHSRRNRNTTSEASSMPSSRVCSVAAKLARVSSTVENIFTNVDAWLLAACRASTAFLTLSSTATSLQSRVFITWKATTGLPSRRAKPRCSPSSPGRPGPRRSAAHSGRRRWGWSVARSSLDGGGRAQHAQGLLTAADLGAAAGASTLKPVRAWFSWRGGEAVGWPVRSGSIITLISRSTPPTRATWATPFSPCSERG